MVKYDELDLFGDAELQAELRDRSSRVHGDTVTSAFHRWTAYRGMYARDVDKRL